MAGLGPGVAASICRAVAPRGPRRLRFDEIDSGVRLPPRAAGHRRASACASSPASIFTGMIRSSLMSGPLACRPMGEAYRLRPPFVLNARLDGWVSFYAVRRSSPTTTSRSRRGAARRCGRRGHRAVLTVLGVRGDRARALVRTPRRIATFFGLLFFLPGIVALLRPRPAYAIVRNCRLTSPYTSPPHVRLRHAPTSRPGPASPWSALHALAVGRTAASAWSARRIARAPARTSALVPLAGADRDRAAVPRPAGHDFPARHAYQAASTRLRLLAVSNSGTPPLQLSCTYSVLYYPSRSRSGQPGAGGGSAPGRGARGHLVTERRWGAAARWSHRACGRAAGASC